MNKKGFQLPCHMWSTRAVDTDVQSDFQTSSEQETSDIAENGREIQLASYAEMGQTSDLLPILGNRSQCSRSSAVLARKYGGVAPGGEERRGYPPRSANMVPGRAEGISQTSPEDPTDRPGACQRAGGGKPPVD